jgi:hypothetical protein
LVEVSDDAGVVIHGFPTTSVDEEDDHLASPLDDIFDMLEFDIDLARELYLDRLEVQKIVDYLFSKMRLLTMTSLVDFAAQVLEKKGGGQAKKAAGILGMLIEIAGGGDAVYSHSSSNTKNLQGIRVVSANGLKSVWTMTKASLEKSSVNILKQIISRIENDFSREVYTLLDSGKSIPQILRNLSDLNITPIHTNSAYFILKLIDSPPPAHTSESSLNFVYSGYAADGIRVGEERSVSWSCSADQYERIQLFMKTLGEEGLRGELLETCSLAYVLNMCVVLDTCVDSAKLKTRIDLINGVRADEAEEGGEEGETGDDERDGEPITPFELRRLFMEDIHGGDKWRMRANSI